jgi:hypothetical protein
MNLDISKMSPDDMRMMYEIQWKDHFEARKQTWKALNITGIITAALIGVQWMSGGFIVTCISSLLLIAISFFGMQITLRHRNSVEITKFSIMNAIEQRLGFISTDIQIPDRIKWWHVFNLIKSNTSLFILRMQFAVHVLGWVLLIVGIAKKVRGL